MEINITFLNGPEIKIDPQVGPQGAQGIQGPQGEIGPQGEDGYTPVKGTDYFTDADKVELVQAVLNQIPAGDSISY
jgi:hypothetical protein